MQSTWPAGTEPSDTVNSLYSPQRAQGAVGPVESTSGSGPISPLNSPTRTVSGSKVA